MILGCIADDFTGASDLANTLARNGMTTTQFIGVPKRPPAMACDAGVIALKTRSAPVTDAVAASLSALQWLKDAGCRQFFFKYCSTFDSTPLGNIGPVAEALLDALGGSTAIVCPAFPTTGRRLFMGHLFVNDRLLNESGMETHPITPMTDPDIRRWLALQATGPVGHVPLPVVRRGADALNAAIASQAEEGRRLIVVDAVEDDDLVTIGRASRNATLITGGSGVALGLPHNFRSAGLLTSALREVRAVAGPGLVLSGSCSAASRAQVAAYTGGHPTLAVDPSALMEGAMDAPRALTWLVEHREKGPMVSTTAEPAVVAAGQKRFGREKLAAAIEDFFAAVASGAVASGYRRLVVGGGETSGAVTTALGLDAFEIGYEIDPGVPALFAESDSGRLGLALKSGNFGGRDFYSKAMRFLGSA